MSGRYGLFRWPQALAGLSGFPPELVPRWNLAPGMPVLMVREHEGELCADMARWGLTPPWLSDFSKAPAHARAEGLAEQPMFSEALQGQRCLIPANGFYEWRGSSGRKKPYWLSAPEGLLYFAGLWACYPLGEQRYLSLAMVTRAAAYLRRPVLLDAAGSRLWLSSQTAPEQLQTLLGGPQPQLHERGLDRRVNDPLLDGPQCLTPA